MVKNLSTIVIINHVSRDKEAKFLKKLLDKVVKDFGVKVIICQGDGSDGIWGGYINSLRVKGEPEKWRMIIHDDMMFQRNAFEKILKILDYAPTDSFVSFYNPANKDHLETFQKGIHVIKTHTNWWSQAMCFPTGRIEELINWCNEYIPLHYKYEDRRIVTYMQEKDLYCYTVLPSLTQHLGAYRSLFKFPGKVGKFHRYSYTHLPFEDFDRVSWEYAFRDAPRIELNTVDLKRVLKDAERAKDRFSH